MTARRNLRASRAGTPVALLAVALGSVGCLACGEPAERAVPAALPAGTREPAFVEVAAASGLDFVHFNGMSGEFHMAEISGSGVALLDYDGDGDLDLYCVQGTMMPVDRDLAAATVPPHHDDLPLSDRLYRNDLTPGGPARFVDVSGESGTLGSGYGMGAATGDYDNDGWTDLYVTNYDGNQLLRNRGDGTFEDVTEHAGVGESRWSVPAVFFDYDRDGRLDLFVGNYLDLGSKTVPRCRDTTGAPDYCGPENFAPQPDRIFRNLGDGTFRDLSSELGLPGDTGPALGVIAADFDASGGVDLYVANDGRANNLWMQRGDGRYEDRALLAGCSINGQGQAEASMGVDAADFDGDGDLDLFMTHLISETNTLYRNDGKGNFSDASGPARLAAPSRLHTSFGTAAFDFDNDGWLDLFVASGAVRKIEALSLAGDPFPFHETNQLFHNRGEAVFVEVSPRELPALELSEVSRGAAFGDLDNDGDTDIVISNNNGPARLLDNRRGREASWIGFEVLRGDGRRSDIGARIEVMTENGRSLLRRVHVDGSYASSNDPRVLVGLGEERGAVSVRLLHSDGAESRVEGLAPGHYYRLQAGDENAERLP